MRQLFKRSLIVGALMLAGVAIPNQARASSVTFQFNCEVTPKSPGNTCVPGGSWGTLTLTDSSDPFRVDIDLSITPDSDSGQPLESFYLNFADPFLTNHKFYLVTQGATANLADGNNPFDAGELLGSVAYSNNNTTPFGSQFKFDLNPNPTGTGQTFSGSLALYDQLPNPDARIDIGVANFLFTTAGSNTPPLYAAYRTNNSECSGAAGTCAEFWAGSTTAITTTPEPASLVLLGTGLVGVGRALRRRVKR